jgi:5-methylcytosine-specific restriction endonuclease McrA
MPPNHCMPHTDEAKDKMRVSHTGVPVPWKHRENKIVDSIQLWKCGRCFEFFPKEGFYKNKRTLLGITSECRKCHTQVSLLTRDKEKTKARRIINEANRRARMQGKVFKQDYLSLESIFGNRCLKCGDAANLQWDHINPIAHGGLHHPTNLQRLCRKCNERKQASFGDYRTLEQANTINQKWVIEFKKL